MPELVIPGDGFTQPLGLRILAAGTNIRAEAGVSRAVFTGGIQINPGVTGWCVEPSVCVRPGPEFDTPGFNASSVIQWMGSGEFHGEVDVAGRELQGLQIFQATGTDPLPSGNLDGLYVHDIARTPGDNVGLNHGVYCREAFGVRGSNMRFENMLGGSGIQLYPNAKNCIFKRFTVDNYFVGIFVWDPGTTGNTVSKWLCTNPTSYNRGPVQNGGGESGNVFSDFVQVPTRGYGYDGVGAVPIRPTVNADLRKYLFTVVANSYSTSSSGIVTITGDLDNNRLTELITKANQSGYNAELVYGALKLVPR